MSTLYSDDEFDWSDASEDVEDAIHKKLQYCNCDKITVYSCESKKVKFTDLYNAGHLIESACDVLYENCPDSVEYTTLDSIVSDDARNELTAILQNWADRHRLNPPWFDAVDIKEITAKTGDYKYE